MGTFPGSGQPRAHGTQDVPWLRRNQRKRRGHQALLTSSPISAVFLPRRGHTTKPGATPPVHSPLCEPTPKGSNGYEPSFDSFRVGLPAGFPTQGRCPWLSSESPSGMQAPFASRSRRCQESLILSKKVLDTRGGLLGFLGIPPFIKFVSQGGGALGLLMRTSLP